MKTNEIRMGHLNGSIFFNKRLQKYLTGSEAEEVIVGYVGHSLRTDETDKIINAIATEIGSEALAEWAHSRDGRHDLEALVAVVDRIKLNAISNWLGKK